MEINPELEKSILKAVPQVWGKIQKSVRRLENSHVRNQQTVDRALKRVDELKHTYQRSDPALLEIEKKYVEALPTVESRLTCPVCRDSDHNNKNNGKPWCFKCNVALVDRSKLKKKAATPTMRAYPKQKGHNVTFSKEEP